MDWYAQHNQLATIVDEDDEDPDSRENFEYHSTKEFVVYLIDAGEHMFLALRDEEKAKSYFEAVMKGISNRLKTRIISRETDEVGICFFNTREKKNIQESDGVYVFSELSLPSAELIRLTDRITEKFETVVGSKMVGGATAKESTLYNALWVAQAMLRTGTSKNVTKRILLFTNNDDPLEDASQSLKADLRRTTLQRAKDAQDLGIEIDLYSFNRPDEQFNVKIFYSDMIGEDGGDSNKFSISANDRFDELVTELTKKEFKKRVVRKMKLTVANGIEIGIRTYAMIRPATTGSTIWLDSRTNTSLKTERSLICSDTGAIMTGPLKRFQEYCGNKVLFSPDEIHQLKKLSTVQLQLIGFKPLACLKAYYNLRPPTFLYPDEQEITGSTCAFIALHRSMVRLQKFAVAFYAGSSNPQLVALVAQEEKNSENGEYHPPGFNMIYLPYADDIRPAEKYHVDNKNPPPRGSREQVDKAISLIKKLQLKDFSVDNIQNPALQRHYAILQALALEENDLPDTKDESLPDEKGMSRPAVVQAVTELKSLVYGERYDEEMAEEAAKKAKGSATSQKRKAAAEVACKEANEYNWNELADKGKLKDLTVVELKYYLTAHKLALSGKKDQLLDRILTHLGK